MQQIPQGLQPLNQLISAPGQTASYAPPPDSYLPPQPTVYTQDQGQWQMQNPGAIPATYEAPYQQQPMQYQQQPMQYQQQPMQYQQQPVQYQQQPVQYQQQPVQYQQQPVQYQQQPMQYQQPLDYTNTTGPVEYKKSGFPLPHTIGGAVLGAVIGSKWKSRPVLGAAIGGAVGLTIGVIARE